MNLISKGFFFLKRQVFEKRKLMKKIQMKNLNGKDDKNYLDQFFYFIFEQLVLYFFFSYRLIILLFLKLIMR